LTESIRGEKQKFNQKIIIESEEKMALRRVFVEGYTTCGYYQGALELWRKVESIPKNNIKVITTQRSRGEYMNWLEKKSKVQFYLFITSILLFLKTFLIHFPPAFYFTLIIHTLFLFLLLFSNSLLTYLKGTW